MRIERGMEDGRKIVFKEKADEMPGCITGDVILVVAQVACTSVYPRSVLGCSALLGMCGHVSRFVHLGPIDNTMCSVLMVYDGENSRCVRATIVTSFLPPSFATHAGRPSIRPSSDRGRT